MNPDLKRHLRNVLKPLPAVLTALIALVVYLLGQLGDGEPPDPAPDSLAVTLSAETVIVGDSVEACLFGWVHDEHTPAALVPLVADEWKWEPEDDGVVLELATGTGHCQWYRAIAAPTASGVVDLTRLAMGTTMTRDGRDP